jgi:hypothetical protein
VQDRYKEGKGHKEKGLKKLISIRKYKQMVKNRQG